MLTIRKSDERGRTRSTWLDSRHTFSFGDYHDPSFVKFGALSAINEDRIAGGGGFRPHPHKSIEIVTWVLEGEIEHRDSVHGDIVLSPDTIQCLRAGSGVTHSEVNVSRENTCHLLQIWITPSSTGLEPSFERKMVDAEAIANRFARLAAPSPRDNELRIAQDAEIWAAQLAPDREVVHRIQPGRRVWLQLAKGHVVLNDAEIAAGDGAAITDEDKFFVRAKRSSELLLVDLA